MNKRSILLVMLLLGVASLTISGTYAADWNVPDGASSSDIQTIIDGADNGDSLNFANMGTYNNISLTVNKSLSFAGNNSKVSGNGNGSRIFTINGAGNYVNITNFNLYGGTGIYGNNVNNLGINNNHIYGGDGNDAISLNGVSGTTITNNVFNAVTANGTRDVLNFVNVKHALIQGNTFDSYSRDGISLASGRDSGASTWNITIDGNNFINGGEEGVYFGGGVDQVTITNNNFTGYTGTAINVERSSTNINISYNSFVGDGLNSTGIRLVENDTTHNSTSPTVLINVTVFGNSIDDNKYGVTLYQVHNATDWENYLLDEDESGNTFSGNTEPVDIQD